MPKDTQQIRLDLGPGRGKGIGGENLINRDMGKETDRDRGKSTDCVLHNNVDHSLKAYSMPGTGLRIAICHPIVSFDLHNSRS